MKLTSDRQEVYRRTAVGAAAFALRELVALPVGVLVSIVLARLLSPADFGVFATVTFLLASLSGLLDLGVGLVLERRTEAPTDSEVQTIFTSRSVCFAAMFLVLWLATPSLTALFRLGPEGPFFLRLVAVSLFLSPIARTSRNLLNRRLQYKTLATIDLVQSLAYQVIAVGLASWGYGLQGLGIAYLAAITCDVIMVYRSAPWPIRFTVEPAFLRTAVAYGGVAQLSSMTQLLRDNVGVLLAGPLFGPMAVGYLNWAQRIVRQVTYLVTPALNRLSFPSLARLQHDRVGMSNFVTAVIRSSSLVTFPVLAAACAVAPEIAQVLYTDKWAPGVPTLYFFAGYFAATSITATADSVLKAVGRAGDSLMATSIWTVLEWALAIGAVSVLGFAGVAVAHAAAAWIAALVLLLRASGHCDFHLVHCTLRPFVAATLAGATIAFLKGHHIDTVPRLALAAGSVVLLSWLLLLLLERAQLVKELRSHWTFAREAFASRQ